MGFKLNNEVIEECAIAAYESADAGTHHGCVRVAARAVVSAIARQLETVVSSPGSDLSTRLDQILKFVPSEEPEQIAPPRARKKS